MALEERERLRDAARAPRLAPMPDFPQNFFANCGRRCWRGALATALLLSRLSIRGPFAGVNEARQTGRGGSVYVPKALNLLSLLSAETLRKPCENCAEIAEIVSVYGRRRNIQPLSCG